MFRHRSFLDFFAAFYVFEKRDEIEHVTDFIVATYFSDLWGEVAFFYIGLRREINDTILGKIFSFKGEGLRSHLDKFCSGRLIQAGWHSPAKIIYDGIRRAVELAL